MTATVETLVDLGPCGWCADGQWDHRQGKKGCKVPGCGCGKYEPPKNAPAAVLKVDPASEVPGELVDGPDGPDLGVRVGGFEPAEPGDVDLPVDEPAAVEVDPAAQAVHAEQVAAIDAQLAEPTCAYPNGDDEGEHDHALCEDVVAERTAAVRAEPDPALAEVVEIAEKLAAQRDEARRERDRLQSRLDIIRQERRREHLAHQVATLGTELDEAREELEHRRVEVAELRAALQGPATDAVVLYRYDADQCTTEGCGSRYTVPVEHPHPLTPVSVLIVRREVPGA